MVEFGLVAPVFFLLLFGMVDGGLLLFSQNAVDNASTVGVNAIASLGPVANADFQALTRMGQTGFADTGLITTGEVDVEGLANNPSGGFLRNSDGTPKVDTSCPTGACINRYTIKKDSGGNVVVTLLNGSSPCGDPSGCPPWPPGARNVSPGTASYVGLVVNYQYRFFTGVSPAINFGEIKTFRLEPQGT